MLVLDTLMMTEMDTVTFVKLALSLVSMTKCSFTKAFEKAHLQAA